MTKKTTITKKPDDVTRTIKPVLDPVHPEITKYIDTLLTHHDEPVLLEMEALARENNFPIVGRQVGVFLEMMALSIGAKRIFEFGSGYGYSAYWFTKALQGDGKVICTDGEGHNAVLAREYLSKVNRWDNIDFMVGWAQDMIEKIDGDFDIIYNDVDKCDYPEVWELAKKKLRPGGLYIADNTLWFGHVTEEVVTNDIAEGWTEAIKEHNQLIADDPDFDFFLNPTRDGVIVARRQG